MSTEKSGVQASEPQKVKKVRVKGKSLRQSGDWFQRNKSLITWCLAIAFITTCIGFTGIMYVSQENARKKMQQNKTADQKIDRVAENIKYWSERVGDEPKNPINIGNLAYAYQEGASGLNLLSMEKQLTKEEDDKYKQYMKLAEENYKKALQIDENYTFAVTNLADIYITRGDSAQAAGMLEKFVKKVKKAENSTSEPDKTNTSEPNKAITESDNIPVYERLCYTYLLSGDNEKVIKEGEEIIKLDPGNSNARVYMAKAKCLQKKYDEALSLSDDVMKIAESKMGYMKDEAGKRAMIRMLIEVGTVQGDANFAKKNYKQANDSYNQAFQFALMTMDRKAFTELQSKVKAVEKFLPKKPSASPAPKANEPQKLQSKQGQFPTAVKTVPATDSKEPRSVTLPTAVQPDKPGVTPKNDLPTPSKR